MYLNIIRCLAITVNWKLVNKNKTILVYIIYLYTIPLLVCVYMRKYLLPTLCTFFLIICEPWKFELKSRLKPVWKWNVYLYIVYYYQNTYRSSFLWFSHTSYMDLGLMRIQTLLSHYHLVSACLFFCSIFHPFIVYTYFIFVYI